MAESSYGMEANIPILLVEDDPNDVWLVKHAFQSTNIANPLRIVNDGQEAVDYLRGAGQFGDRSAFPLPKLVLLDLKMPRLNGFDVITWMRKHFPWKLTPIIVLSSSALPQDVNRAYELGANAYMVKPADYRALERLFRTIADFWNAGEKPTTELESVA
jgi:CheY-like chemotaxis protein